jgi:hypothetical protein
MENRVGSKVPSEKDVEKLVAQVKALSHALESFTVALTAEQRQATTKFRPGGEAIVATVGRLADEHAVALPGVSVEDMSADLLLAQRLAPLATALEALSQRVDDTVLEARSECWWAATALYTSLARVAGGSPALETSLKPVTEFFAAGRRKKTPPSAAK